MSNGENNQAKPVSEDQSNAAKIEEIRELLGEAYGFHSTSPRAQSNINAALELLDELAKPVAAALPVSNERSLSLEMKEEALRAAMRKAFNFGQTYWQQADSDYASQHKKADITRDKFIQLTEDTCAILEDAATPALPAEKVQGRTEWVSENLHSYFSYSGNRDNKMWIDIEDIHHFARELLAASGGVPAPALPVVPHPPITDPNAKGYRPPCCDGGGTLSRCCDLGYCAANLELMGMGLFAAAPELPEGNQQPQSDSGLAIRPSAEPAGQHGSLPAVLQAVKDALTLLSRNQVGRSWMRSDEAIVKAALGVIADYDATTASTDWGPQQTRERFEDYSLIAHLIGVIFFAGRFQAETANERELEALLVKTGHRYANWDEIDNFRKDNVPHDLWSSSGAAAGGNTSDKASLAPSHAASTEPVSNFTATQAAQLTEQDAPAFQFTGEMTDIGLLEDEGGDHGLIIRCGDDQAIMVKGLKRDQIRALSPLWMDDVTLTINAAILANQSQKG